MAAVKGACHMRSLLQLGILRVHCTPPAQLSFKSWESFEVLTGLKQVSHILKIFLNTQWSLSGNISSFFYNTVQPNSFNLTSDNLEILIIQHLRRVFPRPEVMLFIKQSFCSATDISGICSDRLPRVSVRQLLLYLLILCLLLHQLPQL